MYIHGKIWPTTRLLREKLECKAGLRLTRIRKRRLVINWGRVFDFEGCDKVLNRNIVTNKYDEIERFKENDVNAPKIVRDIRMNLDMFPILGRKYHHKQGKDIVKYDILEEYENRTQSHDYYIQFIQKKGEYRVHVLGDEVGCITKKKRMEGENDETVWSKDKGWKQIRYRAEGRYYSGLSDIGLRAVRALGYDFGAVDIIIGRDDKMYALEVNSAPGLIDVRADMYIDYFKEVENVLEQETNS